MDCSRRFYRREMCPEGFVSFGCKVKETDLFMAVDKESFNPGLPWTAEKHILRQRELLEQYMSGHPEFGKTLNPYLAGTDAPRIALNMVRAGNAAGVGPMAAVAGTFAEMVGKELLKNVRQVIVENGGDIFLRSDIPRRVAVFAGSSPLSGIIAVEVAPRQEGCGICTSSGTVGPSYSMGKADAAVILSASAPLADAVATAAGNRVNRPEDLAPALDFARSVPGVEGVLLIKGNDLMVWGDLKLVKV